MCGLNPREHLSCCERNLRLCMNVADPIGRMMMLNMITDLYTSETGRALETRLQKILIPRHAASRQLAMQDTTANARGTYVDRQCLLHECRCSLWVSINTTCFSCSTMLETSINERSFAINYTRASPFR